MHNMILVVIDVQNGFIKSQEQADKAADITELIKLELFDNVVATRFINYTDSMYEKYFNWHSLKTAEEVDLYPLLKNIVDVMFDKATYNCINGNFINLLKQLNKGYIPEKVYLCGLDTDACVLATAIGLFEHGIAPIVLKDYCFSTGGKQYHKAGLKCLERIIGKDQIL